MTASSTLFPRTRRALQVAYWVLPPLFCLWLYWYGVRCWFQQDDFAWLQLRQRVHNWQDLWHAIFTPSQHGTFRPLSERSFFLLFNSLFGLNAVPYRLLVFATEFANLALLASITSRVTGSRAAGFWAPVFWLLNCGLVIPMTWTSAYMQVLCGFCLLLGFHFFLRYVETGRPRYYWLQWAPFLAGFLVMETTIVYPAIVATFALLCSRKHFRSTLPLFVPSAAFGVLHMLLAPKAKAGAYSLHFDFGIVNTFVSYWRLVFEPHGLKVIAAGRGWITGTIIVAMTLVVVAAIVWAVRRRHYAVLFFASWYLIVLAPVLPLREHVTFYYLTLPSIGIAMLVAYALVEAWRGGLAMRAVAAVVLAGFVLVSARAVRADAEWWFKRGVRVEALARGVLRARQLHPQDTILLAGVDTTLFWGAMFDGIFPAIEVSEVYLAPGSEAAIEPHPEKADVGAYVLQPALVQKRLQAERLVVYDVGGPRMRAITQAFRQRWSAESVTAPRRIELGSEVVNDFLGSSWFPGEGTHRWMPKSATVKIAGPRTAAEKLQLRGYCPKQQVVSGPLAVRVSVNGTALQPVRIGRGDDIFEVSLALPPELIGKPSLEVGIEVDRTIRVDGREIGLAFSVIEVR